MRAQAAFTNSSPALFQAIEVYEERQAHFSENGGRPLAGKDIGLFQCTSCGEHYQGLIPFCRPCEKVYISLKEGAEEISAALETA